MKKIIIVSIVFLLFSASSASAADCFTTFSGNQTVSASCTLKTYVDGDNPSRYVSGVDSGTGVDNTATLTISSGTMTINSNETLVAGSVEMTGGSIALAEGSIIEIGKPLYMVDADGDGYATDSLLYAGYLPADGVRLNTITTLASTDCDDANSDNNLTCASNYFGDGSDGDVTISSNTNISCTQDGDMAVMEYSSLTINSGATLTTNNRCKGLFIYVSGNATINGTLSMTARGANVNPVTAGVSATGLRIPMLKSGETDTLAAADFAGAGTAVINAVANQNGISGDGKIYTIARTGGSGGPRDTNKSGDPGGTATNGTGGGGGGSMAGGNNNPAEYGGAGSDGTCFSGGSGGGGADWTGPAQDAGDYGGAGGDSCKTSTSYLNGGGAGNPAGSGDQGADGQTGTGGVVVLIVGGNLTIGATGSIQANGKDGGGGSYSIYDSGGGGSGGGYVLVLYAGSLSNSGSVTANGGSGGTTTGSNGGNGGNGTVVLEQVDPEYTPGPTPPPPTNNYFGDGSDGDVTISTNTQLTVPNKNGSYDGEMVVKNYSSLTINQGVTLTTDQPGRGALIYVSGNATINGTLSMTARGAKVDPTPIVRSTGIRLPMKKSGSTDTLAEADFAGTGLAAISAVANQAGVSGDGKIYTIARTGGSGGPRDTNKSGDPGGTATNGTGGGGGGSMAGGNNNPAEYGGAGSDGTCFSGGSGGGGADWTGPAQDAGDYGGAGGDSCKTSTSYLNGGGAGNPAGSGDQGADGQTGTGGVVVLIVGGNLTIGATGSIQANGKDGGGGSYSIYDSGGGGSGGGYVLVLYAGSLSNSGSVTANGGSGGTTTGSNGGNGGNGTVVLEQVDSIP
ncbi:hypothetical protein ACFL1M_01970 [Patescibacteria group bacterium]